LLGELRSKPRRKLLIIRRVSFLVDFLSVDKADNGERGTIPCPLTLCVAFSFRAGACNGTKWSVSERRQGGHGERLRCGVETKRSRRRSATEHRTPRALQGLCGEKLGARSEVNETRQVLASVFVAVPAVVNVTKWSGVKRLCAYDAGGSQIASFGVWVCDLPVFGKAQTQTSDDARAIWVMALNCSYNSRYGTMFIR